MDPELLSILACPRCREEVTLSGDEKGLICESCRLVYPIREGVPVMLIEEALPLRKGEAPESPLESSTAPREKAVFSIVEGQNKGEKIELEKGTCRALGRSLDDLERTKVFSVGSAISLDEASKKLVVQYVTRQFRKGGPFVKRGEEGLGGFQRGSDIPVRDLAVSRLHAMLFYDESGVIGILDLVSRNGTFVNGTEVESKVLKPGDLIALGGTKIRFES